MARIKSKSRAERTEELRQRILSASFELFMQQGCEKTTTRQIIQRVGILNGSLYNIYKSKDEIFADIVSTTMRELVKGADTYLPPDAPPEEKLCYTLCANLYICNRCTRIAELLSIALEKWYIHSRISMEYAEWCRRMGLSDLGMGDAPDFDLRLDLSVGAMGMVIERMYRDPGSTDERLAMELVCKLTLDAFSMDSSRAEEYADMMLSILDREDIVICGESINGR